MPKTQAAIYLTRGPSVEKTDLQTKFATFLLYGFFFLWRAFVYPAFALTAFLLMDRRFMLDRVYAALTKRGLLSGLCWALLMSTMYGIAGVVYGVMAGNDPFIAIEVFAFNVCPWFVLFGVHAGTQRPNLARSYIRFLAWGQAITTPLYFLIFRHSTLTIGGTEISLQPGSGAIMLLGLFCFETNLSRYWFPILVASFDTLASEIRADWVALAAAGIIWAMATKQMKRVVAMAGIIVALLTIGFVADVRLPGLPGRGGEISARDTVARALSGIDPEIASEYSSNSQVYAGTVQWREKWWRAIREAVFAKPLTAIFGLGYGYPIGDLVTYIKGDVRSPHSILYFVLAYSGILGVAVFAWLQLALFRVLWKTFQQTGQVFGFASLAFFLVCSLFGNFFESPQRSVPTYLLLGMTIGPLLVERKEQIAPERPIGAPRQPAPPGLYRTA